MKMYEGWARIDRWNSWSAHLRKQPIHQLEYGVEVGRGEYLDGPGSGLAGGHDANWLENGV
jgi:hypothetical protein